MQQKRPAAPVRHRLVGLAGIAARYTVTLLPAVLTGATLFASPPAQAAELDEVVVTAQKRTENLSDVPVPVTVVSASTLLATDKTRLQDYFAEIPGLSYVEDGSGLSLVSIRGLASGVLTNPTVGITVDDVPFGASTANGGAFFVPEIDPGDLAQVEVLRGPQGTLYGASSLGGLIKYVTVDPSFDSGVHGQVQAGVGSVHNGAETGYDADGSINIPLANTLAVRASAFTHEDPGFIDNPVLGIHGINESRTGGAHLAALWKPSSTFELKLSALYQEHKQNGTNYAERYPGLGELQQSDVPGAGHQQQTLQGYSATLRLRLGAAELTSITGYSIAKSTANNDWSIPYAFLGDLTQDTFGVPNGTTGDVLDLATRMAKLSEELRLSLPLGQRVELLAGMFYTHETGFQSQQLMAASLASGAAVGTWQQTLWHAPYRETAAFAALTIRITDRFDVQIGGRGSHIEESYDEVDSGPIVPIIVGQLSPVVTPRTDSSATASTYLLTPRFKFSPDLMLYARIASGYRPGGSNGGAAVFGFPATYTPDKTQNYEIGAKGALLEHTLSFDASVYYIDWKNVQTLFVDPFTQTPYTGNGSKAKSQGVELSVQSRPFAGLTLGAWAAVNDARLTAPFPPGSQEYGAAGDRLPFTSRVSGNLSMDEEFAVAKGLTGFVGDTVTYVGSRLGNFNSPPPDVPPRERYPGYATIDLRAGIHSDRFTVTVYGVNVADRRGLLYGGIASGNNPYAFTYIRPRTLGLNISKTF